MNINKFPSRKGRGNLTSKLVYQLYNESQIYLTDILLLFIGYTYTHLSNCCIYLYIFCTYNLRFLKEDILIYIKYF